MSRAQKNAFWLVAVVFALDRISKYWIIVLFDLPAQGTVNILPFFNLTMVWNQGISLGLFQVEGDMGRYLLIALTALITIILIVWLLREQRPAALVGLGLVIGGAIGNIWDRFQYGAVADFLHFHGFGHSFYVFNAADAAISLGVAFLLWDALLSPQKSPT
jgi:signal peptidase II